MMVALAGAMGSGKDTVARILVENFGLIPVSFGSFIRIVCICKGLELTRENLQRMGDELRAKKVLPKDVVRHALSIEERGLDVVITDVRLLMEYEYLKKMGIKIIGVYAPKELRYERLRKRARNGDALTWGEFERLSQHPTEKEAELISLKLADYTIFNTSSIDKLEEQVIDLAMKLGIKPRSRHVRTVASLIYRATQLILRHVEEVKKMFFEGGDPASFLALLSMKLCTPPYMLVFDLI